MKKLILFSVFLIPLLSLLPLGNTIVWYPQLLGVILIGVICICNEIWKMNKFIAILLGYEAFSYLVVCSQSTRSLFCFTVGLMACYFGLAVSKIKDNKDIYNYIAMFAVLQGVYTIFQSFGIDPFFHRIGSSEKDVVGFLGSHNQLGIYSACVGPLLMTINPLLIGFSLFPMFLAKQSSSFIGLMAGVTTYSLLIGKKKAIWVLVLGVLAFIPWFYMSGKSSTEVLERANLWKLSVKQVIEGKVEKADGFVKCAPLTGFGIGNFFVFSPYSQHVFLNKNLNHAYEHAHNDLVESFFELGWAGLAIVLLCIFRVIIDFKRAFKLNRSIGLIRSFSALVATSVCSLFVYVFHAPVSLFMFFLILGLFYGEISKCETEHGRQDCQESS